MWFKLNIEPTSQARVEKFQTYKDVPEQIEQFVMV